MRNSLLALALTALGALTGATPPRTIECADDDPTGACAAVAPRVGHELSVLPIAFYTPETSLAFAAVAVWVHRETEDPAVRASSARIGALYTLRNQISTGFDGTVVLAQDTWRVDVQLGLNRDHEDFYGVGNDTQPGDREVFTAWNPGVRVKLLRRVIGDLFVGPQIGAHDYLYQRQATGGLLDTGAVRGSDDYLTSGVGAVVQWDDRDDPFAPRLGGYYQLDLTAFRPWTGSDHTYLRCDLDLRRFVELPWLHHVVAGRGYVSTGAGAYPWTAMPTLGGANGVRGIYRPRFRDRTATFVALEYRAPLFWRLGAVLFGGVGEVGHALSSLTVGGLHPAGGGGLRFALAPPERVNLTFDVGVGPNAEVRPYVTVGESF